MTLFDQHFNSTTFKIPVLKNFFLFLYAASMGLLLLIVIEWGMRYAGIGQPTSFLIKEEHDGGNFLAVNPWFYQQYLSMPVSDIMDINTLGFRVPAQKVDNTKRIFIFGGSAAHGCTPDAAFGIGRILNCLLQTEGNGTHFEVYNAACPALNSHVMRRAAKACAQLEPDYFVVYMGNNEYSGPFGPAWTPGSPPSYWGRAFFETLSKFRLTTLFLKNRASHCLPHKKEGVAYFAQLQHHPFDSPARKAMQKSFRENLLEIDAAAQQAGAKLILCTVGKNLADWTPLVSLHRPTLTSVEKEKWEALFYQGQKAFKQKAWQKALNAFLDAKKLDEHYAETHYQIGQCYKELGQFLKARDAFILARDYDALLLGTDSALNEVIRDVNKEKTRSLLVDMESELAKASPHSLTDSSVFWDCMHFNFQGSYVVARTLAVTIAQLEELSFFDPISETTCMENMGFNEAVSLEHANALLPAYHFWGVSQKQLEALNTKITYLQQAVGATKSETKRIGYSKASQAFPGDPLIFSRLLQEIDMYGDTKEALAMAEQVCVRFPDEPMPWLYAARVFENAGRLTDAQLLRKKIHKRFTAYFDEDTFRQK